jgi:voltage-gated potassium channel
VSFEHEVTTKGSTIIYIIDFFFLVDIYFNFHTSYRHEGTEILDKKSIKQKYLNSIFILDLITALPLDLILLGQKDIMCCGISVVLLSRLIRLIRINRLFLIFRRWQDHHLSNTGLFRIIKFFSFIFLIIHLISCIWFLSAYIDDFPDDSWAVHSEIENADHKTQYIRSLYWSVTTMTTIGYGDITPNRNKEYIIALIVMILGASTYALVIGNVASLISNLDSTKANYWNRFEAVNMYLHNRQVPKELNEQVRNYYEYIWARHRGLNDYEFLLDLPKPLRLDILLQLTKDLLEKVPLFKFCSPLLRNVLLMALKAQTYSPDGYIVREGEVGNEIFFISLGSVEVNSNEGKNIHGNLGEGDYFGDISLILNEKRTASVKALNYCEIFVLTRVDFNQIKEEYLEFGEVLKKMSSNRTDKITELFLEGVIL